VDTFTDTNLSLVTENLASTRYDQLRSHEKLRTRISVAKQPIKLVLVLTFTTEPNKNTIRTRSSKIIF